MKRRDVLASIVSAASACALAGCSSSGASSDSAATVGDAHSTNALEVELADVAASEGLEIGDDTRQPERSRAFVHVRLEAAAVDGRKPPLYLRDSLALRASSGAHEPLTFDAGAARGCPTGGQPYNGSAVATEQEAAAGWLTFSVPREHLGDLTLVWDPAGYDSMAWELGLSRSDVENC